MYRVSPAGDVERIGPSFGRPQGLAFDADGRLYVVDALAGNSGVFRIDLARPTEAEPLLLGGALIGLAFAPAPAGLVVASAETVYRLRRRRCAACRRCDRRPELPPLRLIRTARADRLTHTPR